MDAAAIITAFGAILPAETSISVQDGGNNWLVTVSAAVPKLRFSWSFASGDIASEY